MVRAYHEASYQGMVITNHFIYGNNSVPKEYSWEEKMDCYWNEYLQAKDEGDRLGMNIFFGIEYYYGRGKEILTYGIDVDFLKAYPDLSDTPVEVYAKRVHDANGFLSLAHPYRTAPYIDPTVPIAPELADGIEVFNGCTADSENESALKLAIKMDKVMTSGADSHWTTQPCLGTAGLIFPRKLESNKDFLSALRNKEGCPIWNSKPLNEAGVL